MALKKFENDPNFRENLCIFNDPCQEAERYPKVEKFLFQSYMQHLIHQISGYCDMQHFVRSWYQAKNI